MVIELIETGDLTLAQTSLIQTQAKAESSQMKEKMIAEIKEKFSLKGTKDSSNS